MAVATARAPPPPGTPAPAPAAASTATGAAAPAPGAGDALEDALSAVVAGAEVAAALSEFARAELAQSLEAWRRAVWSSLVLGLALFGTWLALMLTLATALAGATGSAALGWGAVALVHAALALGAAWARHRWQQQIGWRATRAALARTLRPRAGDAP
jgi:hypothetical protein